jgi:hypothetical protein
MRAARHLRLGGRRRAAGGALPHFALEVVVEGPRRARRADKDGMATGEQKKELTG